MALGLGVSAFARTEFQAVQFMPALIFPQLILCGLFIERSDMSTALYWASWALPLTYSYDALARATNPAALGRLVRPRRPRHRLDHVRRPRPRRSHPEAPDRLATSTVLPPWPKRRRDHCHIPLSLRVVPFTAGRVARAASQGAVLWPLRRQASLSWLAQTLGCVTSVSSRRSD